MQLNIKSEEARATLGQFAPLSAECGVRTTGTRKESLVLAGLKFCKVFVIYSFGCRFAVNCGKFHGMEVFRPFGAAGASVTCIRINDLGFMYVMYITFIVAVLR